jgi:MerR family transcriptional regulator, light-induced transcriptional regulator
VKGLLSVGDGAYQEMDMRNLFGAEHEERHPLSSLGAVAKNKSFANVATTVVAALAARRQSTRTAIGKANSNKVVSQAEVNAFTTLAIGSSDVVAKNFVSNLLARGVTHEEIYLQLLSPSAQRLGEFWACDSLDFARQTLAFCTLQKVFLDLERSELAHKHSSEGSIYLFAAPGCQHTLGVRILSDMFRRRGWVVKGGVGRPTKEILKDISGQNFDVIGISVGAQRELPVVTELLVQCRRYSKNSAARYLLGGAVVSDASVDLSVCGADVVSKDALDAIRLAESSVQAHRRMERLK